MERGCEVEIKFLAAISETLISKTESQPHNIHRRQIKELIEDEKKILRDDSHSNALASHPLKNST